MRSLKIFTAGLGIMLSMATAAKPAPATPNADSFLTLCIRCILIDDIQAYQQLYPTFEQIAKGLNQDAALKKAGPEVTRSLKFQTSKETVSDFLENQYDALKAGVDRTSLQLEKNRILAPTQEAYAGKKITTYKSYSLLRDTLTGISYVMESELDFMESNIFAGIKVYEFEQATSIEAYLEEKEVLKNIHIQPKIGSVKIINMDKDEGNAQYFDKTYAGTIGKDSATFTFNYRNEWGSNFIGSAVYQLLGQEPVKITTSFIDKVSSFFEWDRDITWLVMDAGETLSGYQLSRNGEVLDGIMMRLKE
jgi:hypothetical protein